MYQQKLKKWIICIVFALFLLCVAFATTNAVTASADSYENQASEPYDGETQSDASYSVLEIDMDKAIYKRLGHYRLTEGEENLTQIHYIENANYFLANPLHHQNDKSDNWAGTCTTVALQMLVGYHNYYSDRRLLPKFNDNEIQLLANDYGKLTEHPTIFSEVKEGLGRSSIGTAGAVYDRIFEETFWASFPALGQAIGNVTDGTRAFLKKDSELNNWSLEKKNYNKSNVLSELNAGRPVVIGFDALEGHSAHVIVAYGYATYDGQLCYITHYGWQDMSVQMLVPESWLYYQVTMNVNHVHAFQDTGVTYKDIYRALKCEECGYTALDNRYIPSFFAGGTGVANDPLLISNVTQFKAMQRAYRSEYVAGTGGNVNLINYYFKLTNNITISGDWTPFTYQFAGHFDGNGKYITYTMEISYNDLSDDYHGLFGFITSGGYIENLELRNCKITSSGDLPSNGNVSIGILAGAVQSAAGLKAVTITNPMIECEITDAIIGGIAGTIYYTDVVNCVVSGGSITSYSGALGGMAGFGNINYFSGGKVATTITKKNYVDTDKIGKVVGNTESTSTVNVTDAVLKKEKNCLAAGSLITLADGSQVPVETLKGDEMLLVWNLYTGEFGSAPILLIDKDPAREYRIINVAFSDGTVVKVISEHGFWDFNLNQYVYLDENAGQYLGHWFNKQTTDELGNLTYTRVQLTNITITTEYTTSWSPETYLHLCYYVNGMLTMPGGSEGLFNIFEVDAETMRYDEAAFERDIELYGLFTYEEFNELLPVPEEVFEAYGGQYMKVAIGKGLITMERLEQLANRYLPLIVNG